MGSDDHLSQISLVSYLRSTQTKLTSFKEDWSFNESSGGSCNLSSTSSLSRVAMISSLWDFTTSVLHLTSSTAQCSTPSSFLMTGSACSLDLSNKRWKHRWVWASMLDSISSALTVWWFFIGILHPATAADKLGDSTAGYFLTPPGDNMSEDQGVDGTCWTDFEVHYSCWTTP